MTSQAWIGVWLVTLGIAIKVIAAMGIIAGDIAFVGEASGFGFLLLGKELIPGSADSHAVRSRKTPSEPPKSLMALPDVYALTALRRGPRQGDCVAWRMFCGVALIALVIAALSGCSSMPAPNDAAAEAAKMRAQLAEVKGALDFAEPAIEMLCAIRNVEQCGTARIALRTLSGAHNVAASAITTAESLGVALGSDEVEDVLEQSKALGAAVLALGQEVARVASQGTDRVAPAEPSGQPGAASPAANEMAAPPDASGARP